MKKCIATLLITATVVMMVGCGEKENADLRRPAEEVAINTQTDNTTNDTSGIVESKEEIVKIEEGTQEDGTWIYKILAYEIDDVCLYITYNHVTTGEITKSFALDSRVHCDISNIKVGDYGHWNCPDGSHDELMEIISVSETNTDNNLTPNDDNSKVGYTIENKDKSTSLVCVSANDEIEVYQGKLDVSGTGSATIMGDFFSTKDYICVIPVGLEYANTIVENVTITFTWHEEGYFDTEITL